MITQTYNLNLIPDRVPVIVNCSQYDANSRTIEMTIYDGSTLYSIPSGTTASVRGTKEDNTGFEYPCTISGSKVSFDIQDQMTLFAGKVPCEIRLTDSNGIIGTCNFLLNVEETTLDPDVTISETDLPLLESAEQNAIRAENAADRAETLLDTKQDVLTAGNGIKLDGTIISNVFSNLLGVDLDDITYQCVAYVGDSCTNKPTTYGGILISKCNESSQSYGVQIFISYANTGKGAYYRNRMNGVWYGWNPLYLTAGTGIDITNNVISNPNVYNVGDTLSLAGTHCIGVITGTRNLIRFFIPLNQPILASSISFSNLTISVRATVGTIVENVNVANTAGYSITVSRVQKNGIYIQVTLSTAASSATNNTPLDVQIESLSAVFS